MCLHCLPAYIISGEKPAATLLPPPSPCNMSFFPGLLSDGLFITGFKQFNCHLSWWCFLHVSCVWDSLSFWDPWVYNFLQIWENLSHHLSKYFFLFLPMLLERLHWHVSSAVWSQATAHWCSACFIFPSNFSFSFWMAPTATPSCSLMFHSAVFILLLPSHSVFLL